MATDKPVVKQDMSDQQKKVFTDGRDKIQQAQAYYNSKIEKAPVRSGYNRFTGKYDDNKSAVKRAKNDYIKELVQDAQLFGVDLLYEDAMKTLDDE